MLSECFLVAPVYIIICFTPGKRFAVSPQWADFMPGYLSAAGLRILQAKEKRLPATAAHSAAFLR